MKRVIDFWSPVWLQHYTGKFRFEAINIGTTEYFSTDYMHIFCFGTATRMSPLWRLLGASRRALFSAQGFERSEGSTENILQVSACVSLWQPWLPWGPSVLEISALHQASDSEGCPLTGTPRELPVFLRCHLSPLKRQVAATASRLLKPAECIHGGRFHGSLRLCGIYV